MLLVHNWHAHVSKSKVLQSPTTEASEQIVVVVVVVLVVVVMVVAVRVLV